MIYMLRISLVHKIIKLVICIEILLIILLSHKNLKVLLLVVLMDI
jgi:hypothetical protein